LFDLCRVCKNIIFNSNSTQKQSLQEIVFENNKRKDPASIASALNQYFVSITDSLNIPPNYNITKSSKPSCSNSSHNICNSFGLRPTNFEEINSVINSLKVSAATGYPQNKIC
jgi:hypothetical protein